MKLKCISLAAVIFFAAIATACGNQADQDLSGAAVGVEDPVDPAPGGDEPAPGSEPVKPVDPNQPSDPGKGGEEEPAPVASGPASLKDAANSIAPTARVNHQVLEEACDDNPDCLRELEAFKADIDARCTATEVNVACPQGITQFNTDIPSSQLRAGRVPVGYPASGDVATSIDEMRSGDMGADEPAGGDEPVATAPESFDKLVMGLEEWAATHERVAADLADGTCADADCKAALAAVVDYIEAGCGDPNIACPAGADGFLSKPTADEVASGELGDTFPLTADMIDLVERLKEAPAAP